MPSLLFDEIALLQPAHSKDLAQSIQNKDFTRPFLLNTLA